MGKKNSWLYIAISAIGLALIIKSKNDMDDAVENVWDSVSRKRLMTLHPDVRVKAIQFINKAAKQGIKLRVTHAKRSYAQQDTLYAKGRTTSGKIVTNAKGGQSYHNFALALDVVEMIKGVPQWKTKNWDKIGALGKSFGFFWGGDFESLSDRPHFQMNFGNTLTELRSKRISGDATNGFVNLA